MRYLLQGVRPTIDLASHLIVYSRETPFGSHYCPKCFQTNSSCTTHQSLHSTEKVFLGQRCDDQFTAPSNRINLIKHKLAPHSPPAPSLTTYYQSSMLASTTSTTTTSTNNAPTVNNTSSGKQAQASPMLSAITNTSHSYLHFPNIHHQTSHPPPL
nr:hypothetical transcript [Hymenolepis microstoma]